MFLNRALYALLVCLLAFSPVLSIILSGVVDRPVGQSDWLTFLWVGPALSLPVTLAAARLAGRDQYCAYWNYLESFPGNTKRTMIASWAAVTVLMTAIGLALLV